MNKKPGLFVSVSVLAMIILAASFGMNFGGDTAIRLRPGINPGEVLYVCPVANAGWDGLASGLSAVSKYIYMGFIFVFIVLVFSWGWALYQNLLKDKFSADVYKNPWEITKVVFWGIIICTVLTVTPNHFRKVSIHHKGHTIDYVLCESNSAGARAVNQRAVMPK